MEDPELWRWVWLGVAVVFLLAEMATAGAFFALPFALGGAVACVLAFLGVDVGLQWLAFAGVSAVGVAGFRTLARRLDTDSPSEGVGARRWMGQSATVLEAIPAGVHECGLVRVGREEWRAESRDGTPVAVGRVVRVIDVSGTRLVVWPLEEPSVAEPTTPRRDLPGATT